MQVRFFQEPGIAGLETTINDWLSEDARREIVDVRQTAITTPERGVEIVISVWYMEN